MSRYHQGFFRPTNPKKYKGNPTQIVYRSSWELKMMIWLDKHSSVKSWSSEETIIPYFDPTEGRVRRYFPDFIVEFADKRTTVLEIKPSSQTKPPKASKSKKRVMKEGFEYARNMAKWDAAKKWAEAKGWGFMIITEKELGIFK